MLSMGPGLRGGDGFAGSVNEKSPAGVMPAGLFCGEPLTA
jgi:hypothetical protein